MAYQQIYTSVPSGLVAGRSGFCTAARHRELSEGLASRIENISSVYDRGSQSGERGGGRLPVIYSHRIIDVRGDRAHLLMRIGDAGSDYTGRTNHIAHAFVLDPSEVASLKITPAEAILHLLREGLWQTRYEGAARFLGSAEIVDFAKVSPTVTLPAEKWRSLTGEAANAAHLVSSQASTGAAVVPPEGTDEDDLLLLFAESACLAAPGRQSGSLLWQHSFTTRLQDSEKRSDFDWYGCAHNSPAHMRAVKGDLFVVEVARGMNAPVGRNAEIADGKKPAEAGPTLAATTLAPTTDKTGAAASAGAAATPAHAKITATALPGYTSAASQSIPIEFGGLPREKKKKSWLIPVAGCLGALLLATVAGIFASNFLGGGEIRKHEKAIDAEISKGDWIEAESILRDVGRINAKAFADKSDRFRALQAAVILAENYRSIAANPEKTIGRYDAPNPSLFMEEAEKRARNDGLDPDSVPALAELRKTATRDVNQYEALARELVERAGMDKGEEAWSDGLDSLDEQALELNLSKDGIVRRQLEASKAIREASAKFQQIRERKFIDEKEAEEAQRETEELSSALSKIDLPERDPWKGSLAEITIRISSFKPEVEVELPDIPDPDSDEKMAADGAGDTDSPDAKAAIAIPKTYFRALVPEHVYGYGDIEELSGGFRASALIAPLSPYPPVELKFEAVIHDNLYTYIGGKLESVFKLDPDEKELTEVDGKIGSAFGGGMLLAFPNDEGDRPEFQIVYQNPSSKPSDAVEAGSQYFLEMPLSDMIEETGDGSAARLAPEALAVLANIHFADSSPRFHLVVTGEDEARRRVFSFANPEEAEIDLSADLKQRRDQLKEEVARLEKLGVADASFKESPLPMLGKKLFCDEDGHEWEYSDLKIVQIGQGQNKEFRVVPDREKRKRLEHSGLQKSLEDYTTMREASIKGHPFAHYVNVHLIDDRLRDRSSSGNKWEEAASEILALSRFVSHGDENDPEYGPKYLQNSLASWKEISRLSIDRQWGTPENDYGTFSNETEAEQAIRRVRRTYTRNRVFSDFFAAWNKVFTPENFRTLDAYLSGAKFDPAALENAKKALAEVSDSLSKADKTSLKEMGTFHIVVTTKDGTKENAFRLIKSSLEEE